MTTTNKFAGKKLVRTLSVLGVTALMTTACSTYNPYTGEKQTSKATKGAVIGAVSGAVLGVITGDDARERKKRALIGAGVGGIAGGSVGYYMDVQEAKLRDQLAGTGVGVTRDGDNITLNMPGNITFATDSSNLNSGFYNTLDSVALVLAEYDKTVVELAGHTDSTGSDEYNQSLSQRRASSVSSYLANKGVNSNRLLTIGYGESAPIADNSSPAGREMNRRVELTLLPIVAGEG
ncbi:MAG: OmpA family protein [Gammaproteobacteria bacterium]|nr:OmpA family protein [Gammaproteobacteria bacterium]NNC98439.1 OmpA family protein [Gammaproteobacteria bacterium]NNM14746.1 OmpA family protein [Gammaproteobacteria bacterium]